MVGYSMRKVQVIPHVCLVPLFLGLLLFGCTPSRPVPPQGVDFLRDHQQTLDLGYLTAGLLDDAAQDADLILVGEAHGVATNEDLDFALFTHLYETAGVRTYVAETSYSMGSFLDDYVQTGDKDLLSKLYRALEGTTAWNQARFSFWVRLHAWNRSLPETERVRVVGLDVEHQYPIGVWHLVTLMPADPPPVDFAQPVTTLQTMVQDNAWNSTDCLSAVETLLAAVDTNPEAAAAYLAQNVDEVRLTLHSLQAGFAYYASRDAHAADAARDRYMATTYLALGLQDERAYGKWGSEHVYQAQYRGLDRFAMLLDAGDSPISGRVLSLDIVYTESTKLRIRDGVYSTDRLDSPHRIVDPLQQVASGDTVLFQLTGETSPFEKELYLLEKPTGGGVTTDYVQFVILIQGGEAALPLAE